MIGLACILISTLMCFLRKDLRISIPEITKGVAGSIVFWNLVPQLLASFGTVIPDHKWPDFIQFKDIFAFGRQKTLLDSRLLSYFLWSMVFKVLREIWCRRAIPCLLGRSRYADKNCSFAASLRWCFGYMTADLPQAVHKNCWFPALFLPFLTTLLLLHFGH